MEVDTQDTAIEAAANKWTPIDNKTGEPVSPEVFQSSIIEAVEKLQPGAVPNISINPVAFFVGLIRSIDYGHPLGQMLANETLSNTLTSLLYTTTVECVPADVSEWVAELFGGIQSDIENLRAKDAILAGEEDGS